MHCEFYSNKKMNSLTSAHSTWLEVMKKNLHIVFTLSPLASCEFQTENLLAGKELTQGALYENCKHEDERLIAGRAEEPSRQKSSSTLWRATCIWTELKPKQRRLCQM